MDKTQLKESRFYLSRKLIWVIGIFIIAASILVVLTNFSLNMTAATGDYSRLLTSWNQHHYQATVQVERFARSGNEEDFKAYQKIITEKKDLEQSIEQLFKDEPDVKRVFEAFGDQTVYPNEVAGLITAAQYFNSTTIMREMFRKWKQLEAIEIKQQVLVDSLHQEWGYQEPRDTVLQTHLETYNKLNQEWNNQNGELMAVVADASGIVKRFGLWISVILGMLLVLIGVIFSVRANKSIGRWEEALYEKELLLSEIHHRVKNNMAVVSGMLEMESMDNGNPEKALRESRDRIKSMAMIHETLYQSDSFSEINLADYMHDLTNQICSTYFNRSKDITLETNFDHVQLNINQAVPVGLIVNEILTNIVENGFEEMESGKIGISLHDIDRRVKIQISGYTNVHFTANDSTMSAIVDALVQQIGADLTFENDHALKIELVFQKSDAAGSSNALF